MPTYERVSVIPADFETVWEFYDGVEELEILTPDWTGMAVSHTVGPDGDLDPDGYRVGTEVHLELQPFGLDSAPKREWVVEIVEREVNDDRASFVDEQLEGRGPYETWRHTHRFAGLGDETVVHERD
ncbi:cyclase [Natronolimnohabitans sp. A-GB9]|uniref:SRPBCC family protein n=1 Tax=Natronolimnohabitans sp. A-GB9 TaxID=3069757 RepID=UPI0027B5B3BE|nr:cyclase [Natronolimnohabitans sp. A-GB9]MDQ2049244.1 cyclase [Natronolimnohabitans sp. A-GB9]